MDEDWDCDSRKQGKIFGNRGRGFIPAFMNSSESKVGRRPPSDGFHKNENEFNNWEGDRNNEEIDGNSGYKSNYKKRGTGNDNGWGERQEKRNSYERPSGNGGERDAGDFTKPKPSIYIPKEPTEDEDEIFGSGISSGINFNKYDDIEVNVSGENPPQPIRNFVESGVGEFIVNLIKRCNYAKPTPIQKYSIPIIMSGRDLMACAQTGSGKTAAFLIPIMDRLLQNPSSYEFENVCKPQALIISPTRELTIQIFNEARKFSRGSALKIELVYGGTSVGHQLQTLTSKGCDVLVATPGRLLDIVRRGKLVFSRLKFIVLDEADRMLDLGFLPDMEKVMNHVTNDATTSDERQTLMFSATYPEEIQRLAGKFLNNYLFVTVGIVGGACSDVEQKFYAVSKFDKRNKLVELLSEIKNSKCLVFVEQKRITDVLATFLSEKGFRATSIHGDREQREREEALCDFKSGRMNILVATSVAARGLDIKDVGHVVNYDLPKYIDDYVHRIGRTGRVGNRGSAISFYDEFKNGSLAPDLIKILKQSGQVVPDFLQKCGNGAHAVTSPSKFGGKDCRRSELEDAASPYTFEEETW